MPQLQAPWSLFIVMIVLLWFFRLPSKYIFNEQTILNEMSNLAPKTTFSSVGDDIGCSEYLTTQMTYFGHKFYNSTFLNNENIQQTTPSSQKTNNNIVKANIPNTINLLKSISITSFDHFLNRIFHLFSTMFVYFILKTLVENDEIKQKATLLFCFNSTLILSVTLLTLRSHFLFSCVFVLYLWSILRRSLILPSIFLFLLAMTSNSGVLEAFVFLVLIDLTNFFIVDEIAWFAIEFAFRFSIQSFVVLLILWFNQFYTSLYYSYYTLGDWINFFLRPQNHSLSYVTLFSKQQQSQLESSSLLSLVWKDWILIASILFISFQFLIKMVKKKF